MLYVIKFALHSRCIVRALAQDALLSGMKVVFSVLHCNYFIN